LLEIVGLAQGFQVVLVALAISWWRKFNPKRRSRRGVVAKAISYKSMDGVIV